MRRLTAVLTCFLYRRRIGAWLDGALSDGAERATGRHVARCRRCAAEAGSLRRLRTLLTSASRPLEPDWTGFWPGVVRGVEAGRRDRVRGSGRVRRWTPRLAYGGLAAALLVAVTIWQLAPEQLGPENPVIVRSAETEYPTGHVMVYSNPERDLTVVWVVGAD